MHSAGRFISLEGIEGAGKSTQINLLQQYLNNLHIAVTTTREPGGTVLGEQLRSLILAHRAEGMAVNTELLLMFAARSEHLARVILPALAAGSWVVSDRFTDASYAYQGGGRGIAEPAIAALEEWLQGSLRPDLILLLDLPVAMGLERAGRRAAPDRFESEQAAFFERVRESYLHRARNNPQRYRIIDASQPLDMVWSNIQLAVAELLR